MAQFSATVSFYGDNYCVQNHASCISAKYHRYRSQFNKVSAKTSAVGLSPFHDTVYVRSSALCAVETLDLIGPYSRFAISTGCVTVGVDFSGSIADRHATSTVKLNYLIK